MGADDAVADDGDVGFGHRAGDDVEQADVLDDEIGRFEPAAGPDHAYQQFGGGLGHATSFPGDVASGCCFAAPRSRRGGQPQSSMSSWGGLRGTRSGESAMASSSISAWTSGV